MSYSRQYKNESGQILMIVMIIGMIGLLIAIGMTDSVSRLTESTVEEESHGDAFSVSDTASRSIIEYIDAATDSFNIESISEIVTNQVNALLPQGDGRVVSISPVVVDSVTGVSLEKGTAYEINITDGGDGGYVEIWVRKEDLDNSDLLLTAISRSDEYYVGKAMVKLNNDSCSVEGDASDSLSCEKFESSSQCTNRGVGNSCLKLTYSVSSEDKSLRIRPIGGDYIVSFYVGGDDSISLAYKFAITTSNYLGEKGKEGVRSETTIFVPTIKVVSTAFDFALYNGKGQISK